MMILTGCFFFRLVISVQPSILLIEGNIGVGKSTFLSMLHSYLPELTMISEPCSDWQDVSGHNLLAAFYKDAARWSCTMQLYALMTFLRKMQKIIDDNASSNLFVMERSLYSCRYCFATHLYAIGCMNDLEWALYTDAWNWYITHFPKPIGIIYLRADPEICYERMKLRARNEESVVPLSYLKMLHERHERWLMLKEQSSYNIPVLEIDASCNFKDDKEQQKQIISQILDFLKNQENTIFTR